MTLNQRERRLTNELSDRLPPAPNLEEKRRRYSGRVIPLYRPGPVQLMKLRNLFICPTGLLFKNSAIVIGKSPVIGPALNHMILCMQRALLF